MQKIRMSRKGLIVIPANIRRKLNLKYGDTLSIKEEEGMIKLTPKVKLRSLWGTWPELDSKTITKEIIEDREFEEEREIEREKLLEKGVKRTNKRRSNE